jgi:hypothetical protein
MTSTQEIFLEDINAFPLNSFKVGTDIVSQPVYSANKLPISNLKTSAADQDKNSIGG